MNKKMLIIAAIIVVVIAGVFALTSGKKDDTNSSNTTRDTTSAEKKSDVASEEVAKPASFSEGYEKVKVGMTQAQVATLLGEPMGECKKITITQLNTTMTTCNYRDPATTEPSGIANVTVDFDDGLKVMQKQKY